MKRKAKPYPAWICGECAEKNGGKWPKNHEATLHSDYCGWCGEFLTVTQPRDWGYPKWPGK